MAENDELSGRVVRIDRNFANISVSGRAGNARLDTSAARRITGSYIDDVRDILEINTQVKVRVVPMSEEVLSKIPERFRKTVRRNSQWEVKFFKRDIEPAPQGSQFNVPERYFTDVSSFSGVPREAVGRIISALLQITFMLNNTSLQKLLPLVKSHFKVKEIPDIGRYLATEGDLERFILNCPQYFTISSSVVKRCCGFSEEFFNSALIKKTLEIQPPSTAGKRRQTAAASAASDPVDFKDVLSQTEIIDSVEDCNRVLDPILDQSTRQTVVIGLDCEGVRLGTAKGCLTLVQISTWDGKAFLFDAFKNPQLLKGNSSLKKILEHNSILKVIHDCKSDTYGLHHGFGVKLKNVFDTSIAMRTIMEQVNRYRSYRVGFKALCELLGEGATHKDDDFVKKMLETPDFWKIRPLTEEMIYYAASDALCLIPSIYLKFNGMLTPLWRDLFTWSCKDTMESIQKRKQQGGYQGN
ncbi:uncharacterized protein LOC762429 [Strongylocentrotus purpuratus]|uniref:3'-5' exonuclease domain-containing protein n=1 Tax=Strongylocentrotus purpuratus TaxID=7668 RepID=A0A7M7PS85_STRPU|nr:uncharacterized protein LOC762429 [Strongylocentrotus purpuratus]